MVYYNMQTKTQASIRLLRQKHSQDEGAKLSAIQAKTKLESAKTQFTHILLHSNSTTALGERNYLIDSLRVLLHWVYTSFTDEDVRQAALNYKSLIKALTRLKTNLSNDQIEEVLAFLDSRITKAIE